MRWGQLSIHQASHLFLCGLAHRISKVTPKVLLFRVDVLTSLEGQRVFKYVHSILDLNSLVSKKMKIVSGLEIKDKSVIMTR